MNNKPIYNLILAMFLVFGILAPKISPVISMVFGSDTRTIVICTGDGLQKITLDENGDPVSEGEVISDLCLQVSSAEINLTPFWQISRAIYAFTSSHILAPQHFHTIHANARISPVRAPPAV